MKGNAPAFNVLMDGDEDETIRWRGDPRKTFSDWTIQVASKPSKWNKSAYKIFCAGTPPLVAIYHVHRNILAYGARKSLYFANLFGSEDRFFESKSATSKIELEPLATEAFPQLLDFIYSENPLKIETKTATALYFLGEYFGVTGVTAQVIEYCEKDFSVLNARTYYDHARLFQNDVILDLLAAFVGKNVGYIPPLSSFVKATHPPFWAKVALTYPCDAPEYSLIVAANIAHHKADLDLATFRELVDEEKVPCIHPLAALRLCDVQDKLQKASAESSDGSQDGFYCSSCDSETISFQERCASALSRAWLTYAISESEVELLHQRNSSFLTDLLVKYQLQSKEELERVNEM